MSDYAIVETGSKQIWVEPKAVIEIEKLDLGEKKETVLDRVLLAKLGSRIEIGTPWIKGAQVICECLGETRGDKTVALKYRRRKASRTKKGHRQTLTKLRVKEIKI